MRNNLHKINSTSTTSKFTKQEFVRTEELTRTKERINAGFSMICKLFEETINRDSVIAENLLETQNGKMRKLICRRQTNDALRDFVDNLQEPFYPPDILLSLAPPREVRSETMSSGGRRNSTGRKRLSSTKRSRSSSRRKAKNQTASTKASRYAAQTRQYRTDNEDVEFD
jgi:hypothetical protein